MRETVAHFGWDADNSSESHALHRVTEDPGEGGGAVLHSLPLEPSETETGREVQPSVQHGWKLPVDTQEAVVSSGDEWLRRLEMGDESGPSSPEDRYLSLRGVKIEGATLGRRTRTARSAWELWVLAKKWI